MRNDKNMENLRSNYNYKQRLEFQDTLNSMRAYLLPILLKIQGGCCKRCELPADKYDIHHVIYNPKMTINELELLCEQCHKDITDYSRLTYAKI